MGIPHLTHSLQPHGTKVVLPQNPAEHQNAIIDGPSLAYHVFYVCVARRSGARNAFEAAPSYKELGDAALAWLEQIEQYGMKIKNVLFDGLLPPSKQETRLSRLQNYSNQLVNFKALHKEDLPARQPHSPSSNSDVLSSYSSSNRLKALPAPPFLVPAVIETLLESRFGSLVSVIPGEADEYCADAVQKSGGVIFTSDSDLLVHDLGPDGKVILLRDLEIIHLPSRGKCLKTQQYHPTGIAKKFGLQNLVKLAFHMTEDGHRSFAENAKLAAKEGIKTEAFEEFAAQYGSLQHLSKLALEENFFRDDVARTLSRLDPRISEIVHLVRLKKEIKDPNVLEGATSQNLDMYLPFIIDDPTRTSAWRSGDEIRTLAYSLLRLLNPDISTVTEMERKGTRIAGTLTELHDLGTLETKLTSCLETLRKDITQHQTLSTLSHWRVTATRIVCESNLNTNKPPPSKSDLTRLLTNSNSGLLSWSYIQTSAQFQTSLYSLRLLCQISTTVYSMLLSTNPDINTKIPKPLQELRDFLAGLPRLHILMDTVQTVSEEQTEAATTAVSTILSDLGVIQAPSPPAPKRKKRKKKGEHGKEERRISSPGAAAAAANVSWKGNNMFGNLA